MFLRQSTAQTVRFGPFLDSTDGITAETGLTIAQADMQLSKDGGAFAQKNTAGNATHDTDGWYFTTLDTTDSATVGEVIMQVNVSGALPVWVRYWVLEEIVYDAIYGASAAGLLDVNAIQISGDSVAADNLELMYDGTGYTDNTAPSSRLQVSNIGAANGGSVNFAPIEDNTGGAIVDSVVFVGSVASGTFADVGPGATTHSIDDTGNDIDIVYGYQVGGNRIATSLAITADVDGGTDLMSVKVYDHEGATWDTVGEIDDDVTLSIPVTSKYTGTGAELGKVYVRFDTDTTTPSNLEVTSCLVAAVNTGQSVGYLNGAIWLDTNASNTNTESYVDGVADNPVSTIAAALTLAGNLGLKRIVSAAGSSWTMASDFTNYELMGNNYTVAFGGQTITGAKISGATLSGTFVGSTAILEDCVINAITGAGITMRRCFFNEVTVTANGAGAWYLNDCRSRVAGSGSPRFDFGVGVGITNLNLRAYSGGIEIENMGDTGADTMSMEGDGALTINANCDAGSPSVRGNIRITDNSGGNLTPVITPDVTGYVGGSVWVDEDNGSSSGDVRGIDATFQNQSDDFDNAQSVADSLGSQLITIRPGNSVTLSAALQGYTINNVQATLNGGSQDIDSTRINGGFLAGTFTRAGTGVPTFSNANLNNITSDRVACINNCGILGTFTLAEAGVYVFNDAQAAGATSVATIDFASLGGATVSMQRWSGSLTVTGMASGDTLKLHCTSGDDIIIGGADGTVEISGVIGTYTDNRTGSPSLANNALSLATVNTEIDTALSDYDPPTRAELTSDIGGLDTKIDNIETDTQDIQGRLPAALVSGRMNSNVAALNDNATSAANLALSTLGIVTGEAVTGTLSTTQMSTDLAETTDVHYVDALIVWTSGDLAGQRKAITDYNGTTKVVTFETATDAPADGDTFIIV